MQRICVYCGANAGSQPAYAETAQRLATALVRRGWGLVYGGAHVGLMGNVADAVLAQGGEVIGVIPQFLMDKELAHQRLTELRIVGSMHERKAIMAELADGFIALPGGLGTLEELFEILTWAQLGLHRKPCGLLNSAAYYDGLVEFLDHATAQCFISPTHRQLLMIENDPEVLLQRFAHYQAPDLTPWLHRDQI